MPNHVHLIVIPATDKSMGRAIGRAHRAAYTQSWCKAHGHSGHTLVRGLKFALEQFEAVKKALLGDSQP